MIGWGGAFLAGPGIGPAVDGWIGSWRTGSGKAGWATGDPMDALRRSGCRLDRSAARSSGVGG